jgi:hypothetical protein
VRKSYGPWRRQPVRGADMAVTPGRAGTAVDLAFSRCPVKSRVFGVMTATGHSGAAAKNWSRAPAQGASTSSRWWLATLLEIVRSCFDLLVCELQSDLTSSGTVCRGWLYLPEGVTRPGARAITGAAMLVVLTSLMQSLLAGLADDHAIYGVLHAFHGLLILGIAAYLYARSRQRES